MPNRVSKCWKYSVFLYIILYCLSGIALTTLISFVLIKRFSIRDFLDPPVIRKPIFFLYLPAGLIPLTAVLGFISVLKKHKLMLKLFAIILSLLIVLEIGLAVWTYTASRTNIRRNISKSLEKKFDSTGTGTKNTGWDDLQIEYECCGVSGYKDYSSIPQSCMTKAESHTVYKRGCLDAVTEAVAEDFLVASVAAVGIAILQIPGAFVSWALAHHIKKDNSEASEIPEATEKKLLPSAEKNDLILERYSTD